MSAPAKPSKISKPKQTIRGGYVVIRRGDSSHRLMMKIRHHYEHPSEAAAFEEAARLANLHNREFCVFRQIGAVLPQQVTSVEAA